MAVLFMIIPLTACDNNNLVSQGQNTFDTLGTGALVQNKAADDLLMDFNNFIGIIEDQNGKTSILFDEENSDAIIRKLVDVDLQTGKIIGNIITLPPVVSDVMFQVAPGKNVDYTFVDANDIYIYNRGDWVAYKAMNTNLTLEDEFVMKILMVSENSFIGTGFYSGAEQATVSIFTRDNK